MTGKVKLRHDLLEVEKSVSTMHAHAVGVHSIDPKMFDHQMSFKQFFQLVAGCIASKGRSLQDAYKVCPSTVHNHFPFNIAQKNYKEFLAGEAMEGDISPSVSTPILRALYFGTCQPPIEIKLEDNNHKPESSPIIVTKPPKSMVLRSEEAKLKREYHSQFLPQYAAFRTSKNRSIRKIWELLPENIKAKYSFVALENYISPNTKLSIPPDTGKAILETYQKFPDYDLSASHEEAFKPLALESQIQTVMSPANANKQISVAMEAYKVTRQDLIEKFSLCLGIDLVESKKLLSLQAVRPGPFPRLRAAIALAIIGGHPVSETAIDLHNKYSKDQSTDLTMAEMRLQLNEIFDKSAHLSPQKIYASMPDTYQNSFDFNEVARWLDGRLKRASKAHVAAFLNQTVAVLEQNCTPE